MDIFLFASTALGYGWYLKKKKNTSASAAEPMSFALLKKQNAQTSNAIIYHYSGSGAFSKLSQYEGDLTVTRDREDDDKLAKGIQFAQSKGVIDPKFKPEPYVKIDVLGKSPDQVANLILSHVEKADSKKTKKNAAEGSVIVLVGLSGTGKGTTALRLRQLLEADAGHQVVTWSNGNIFRSVTLLAATWCEQNTKDGKFDKARALTKENLATFMGMLSFGKFNGDKYDTRIRGLGLDLLVSDVQNTTLKGPKVSSNIPTVAEFTQGEVILFAAAAVKKMCDDGIFVLLEGREQTVNYVRTPHRFTLMLSDESLIGKRRAAQRLMAGALDDLTKKSSGGRSADVVAALDKALDKMAKEI